MLYYRKIVMLAMLIFPTVFFHHLRTSSVAHKRDITNRESSLRTTSGSIEYEKIFDGGCLGGICQ